MHSSGALKIACALLYIYSYIYTLYNHCFIDSSYQFCIYISIPFIMFLLCTAPPRVFDISSVHKLALCVFTHQNQYPYTPSYIHVYVVCMFFKLLYTQWPIYVGGVWVNSFLSQIKCTLILMVSRQEITSLSTW